MSDPYLVLGIARGADDRDGARREEPVEAVEGHGRSPSIPWAEAGIAL